MNDIIIGEIYYLAALKSNVDAWWTPHNLLIVVRDFYPSHSIQFEYVDGGNGECTISINDIKLSPYKLINDLDVM